MNELTETDLEQLEAWLDGELDEPTQQMLRRRADTDPDFAAAVEEATRQRQIRRAVFASLEGTDDDARRLMWRAAAAASRRSWWTRVGMLRPLVGAAACLALLYCGWAIRDGAEKPIKPTPVTAAQYEAALVDSTGRVVSVRRFNTRDEAQRFADDFTVELDRWQARRSQVQNGAAVLVADQF